MIPICHDHRVAARAPRGGVPYGADLARKDLEYYGRAILRTTAPVAQPRSENVSLEYPSSSPEAVSWREGVRMVRDIAPGAARLVWEIAQLLVPAGNAGVLQRIGTYLRAQALDVAGAPVGDLFVSNTLTDPLALPLLHPDNQTPLDVQFVLEATNVGDDVAPLTAAPIAALPSSGAFVQLPRAWADLRYAWQSRYSDGHHATLPASKMLRLFVVMSADENWRVDVGGVLGGWVQRTGPRLASLRSAESV